MVMAWACMVPQTRVSMKYDKDKPGLDRQGNVVVEDVRITKTPINGGTGKVESVTVQDDDGRARLLVVAILAAQAPKDRTDEFKPAVLEAFKKFKERWNPSKLEGNDGLEHNPAYQAKLAKIKKAWLAVEALEKDITKSGLKKEQLAKIVEDIMAVDDLKFYTSRAYGRDSVARATLLKLMPQVVSEARRINSKGELPTSGTICPSALFIAADQREGQPAVDPILPHGGGSGPASPGRQ